MTTRTPPNEPAIEPVPTGAVGREFRDRARSDRPLPLERPLQRLACGWAIRLPVRADHVRIEKRTVIVERVTVRRAPIADTVRVDDRIRREEVRIETGGDVEATQPLGESAGPDAPPRGRTRVRARSRQGRGVDGP
jgi:hypothetical protein